jgi:hypothetical protein
MRDVKSKVIDAYNYRIQQLGAKQGRAVLARLMKLMGPIADADNEGEAFAKIAASISDDDLDYFCRVFGAATQFHAVTDDKRVFQLDEATFDEHFAGRYGEMLKWLWACIDANFANFFAGLGINPQLPDLAATAGKTTTST